MNDESQRKILENLKLSGFTLEIDALNCLMKKLWSAYPQFGYLDKQTEKLRTVDIVSSPYGSIWEKSSPKVIIECKSSNSKPWVFFTPLVGKESLLNTPIKESLFGAALEMIFSLGKQLGVLRKTGDTEMIPTELANKLNASHYLNGNVPIAYSYHVVGRGNREDSVDDLREGLYQVNNAFNSDRFPKNGMVFLVIVFKGEMYSINEEKALNPVKHVIFVNTNTSDMGASSPPRLIDIVRDSYFEEYLDILENDIEMLRNVKFPEHSLDDFASHNHSRE